MLLYRLIMWKRRWFGFAPQRYYIVERIPGEIIATMRVVPMPWMDRYGTVCDSWIDYWRDYRCYLWRIR